MAHHKSALKRHRQSLKRAARNKHYRTMIKTAMKKAGEAVKRKDTNADEVVRAAISLVDKVRRKGIIPRNRASRYISRLSKSVSK